MSKVSNEELNDLWIAIGNKDESAIEKFYGSVGKVMYKIALGILRNLPDAEDAVEKAMENIVLKAKTYRYQKNAFGWVNTIVHNVSINLLKKIQRQNDVRNLGKVTESTYQFDENSIYVNEIMGVLNAREREVIYYRFWYNMSFSEISKVYGISKSVAKYRVDRALEKARKILKIDLALPDGTEDDEGN